MRSWNTPPLKVVTFFTEGPPHDNCLPLTETVAELRSCLAESGVQLVAYSPRTLLEDDYYRNHCQAQFGKGKLEEPGMELLPHAAKLGYYAWKPLVICKVLSQLQPGDMLLFMDANLKKYKDYRQGLADLRSTCTHLLQRTDIFVPLEDAVWKRIRNHCKALTLDLMEANTFDIAYAPCICVNRILLRKSALTDAIMAEWLQWCANKMVISPIPNPYTHPLCLFHTPEQAILAVLLRKRVLAGDLPQGWPFYSYAYGHRIFHLRSMEDWPISRWASLCSRLRAMLFFLRHAAFSYVYPVTDSFWSQFPRATGGYLLKFAWRGFLMCMLPLPENC